MRIRGSALKGEAREIGRSGGSIEKKPIDPWGHEYQYKSPGVHRTFDYDLFSFGRDGIESEDDVKNWEG